jgi:hypothetical protein
VGGGTRIVAIRQPAGRAGMRKVLFVAATVAAVCATIPGASTAAPPVLQGVTFDQTTKTLSVTWSLPSGVESRVLEASMNSAVDAEGYFVVGAHHGYHGDDIISELPDKSATAWVHDYPNIVPGQYYVHVGALDTTCSTCSIEWTALGTFTAEQPPPPPPPVTKCHVPAVVGKTLAKAKTKIRAAHCSVGKVTRIRSKKKKGNVVKQSPAARKVLPAGSKVKLWVSHGKR